MRLHSAVSWPKSDASTDGEMIARGIVGKDVQVAGSTVNVVALATPIAVLERMRHVTQGVLSRPQDGTSLLFSYFHCLPPVR